MKLRALTSSLISAIALSAAAQDAQILDPLPSKGPKKAAPTSEPVVPETPKPAETRPAEEPKAAEEPKTVEAPKTTPQTSAAVTPAPESKEPKREAKPPSELAAGLAGKVSLHALLQAWADSNPTADKFNTDPDATFRIRRAELKLSGELIPKRVSYVVMTDLSRALFKLDKPVTVTNPDGTTSTVQGVVADNVVPLRDLYTVVKTKYVDVWLGQFKIPISLEGMSSPAQLLFPERALTSKTFGDKRDLGVKLERKKDRNYLSMSIYNGAGENRIDTDQTKELAGRYEFTTKIKDKAKLLVGTAGLISLGPSEQQHKQIMEADLRVEAFGALIQGEIISSFTQSAVDDTGLQPTKTALGYYIHSAYTTKHGVQVAGRFGVLDPDVNTAPDADAAQVAEYGASVNYFFSKDPKKTSQFVTEHPEYHEVKLQAAFSRFVPTSDEHDPSSEFIVALQSWF